LSGNFPFLPQAPRVLFVYSELLRTVTIELLIRLLSLLTIVLPVTNLFNLSPAVGVVLLPAVAAFLFSLAALALKRANQLGVDVWQTAFVVNISAGVFYSALLLVGGPPIRFELWYQPVLIAICLFAGMLAQFMALNRGEVSVAVPVMGLKLLVVALMSPIVVGEAIPVQLWVAVALSLLGITMLNRGGRSGSSRSFTIAVTSGLLAAISFGAFDLLAAKWGQAWGVGRLLPCIFWINAIFSLACSRGFQSPLRSRSRLALAWLSVGALLLSLQGLLFIGCLVIYGRAAQTNVTYSIRGLMSVLLVWSVGRYFQNDEGKLTRTVLVNRLIGAACLLSAIVLAVK
jgi:drug/metabolite transporter (DMT)-like permease